jgi:hypothetical protein
MEVQSHAVLTLTPDGGEWSASRPDHFTAEDFFLHIGSSSLHIQI